ncbi:MAG TPA: HNH endonuclease [Polyangiaceae bacterium]|nr:HNH endonuclease [Polyangiaceae bacterium]
MSSPVALVRARATIPPAVRRRVLERDQHRCQIPGCRHTLDLDVHHIVPRADGGTHDPRYLITLCGAHHRAIHAGRLLLSGTAQALCVRHADGSPYGAGVTAAAASNADIGEKVSLGLRGLGYKETEAKRALVLAFAEHAHEDPGHAEPVTTQELLRRTLVLLGSRQRRA